MATIQGTPGTAEDAIAGSTHAVGQTFTADVSAFPDSILPDFIGASARAGWLLLDVPARLEAMANSYETDYDSDMGLWLWDGLATFDPVDVSLRRELLTAATFDDSAPGYVTVPYDAALDLGNTFTLEAVVRRGPVAGFNRAIVSKGAGAYYMRIDYLGRLSLMESFGAQIAVSSSALSTGVFHHCMAVKTPTEVKVYVDGFDVTAGVANVTLIDNGDDLDIGADWLPGNEGTDATISHVAVYNVGLTATDAAAHVAAMGEHYRATVLGTAGLVGLWGLGEASGSTAEDLTGNGLDGTYSGTGVTLGVPSIVGGNGQRIATTLRRGTYLLGIAQHVDDPVNTALTIHLTTWPADALLRMGVDDLLSVASVEPFVLGTEVVVSVEPFAMIGPPVSIASVERFEIQGPQATESVEAFDIEGPLSVESEEPFSMFGPGPDGDVEVFPGGYVASPLIGWRDPS